VIKKQFSPRKVEVRMYGSMKNGLAIEHSDIDLRVVGLDISSVDMVKTEIKLLEKKLRTEKYVKSTASIVTAKVPVIKLVTYYLKS
jgi:DNA polymerase sigma